MIHVALVTDRAGSFATLLARPVPRLVEEGRILVTTLATFDHEVDAQAFLRELRGLDVQQRERMPQDLQALERHGLLPARPSPGGGEEPPNSPA
jgi:hypothetical protein